MSGVIWCSLLPSLRMPSVIFKTNRARITPCKTVQRRSTKITAEVNFINGEEAKKLVEEEGYVVLDVRDKTQYDRAHIKSCYHVPLFIENKDNDLGTIIKRTVHNNFSGLFFGLPFTKLNPDFVKLVKEQFSTDSKLLLVCQEGLRSTAATNKLEEEGFQNLSCITSGLQSVKPGTFNSEGSSELQNAGKAGLVTIQGKISAVLGTVLISMRWLAAHKQRIIWQAEGRASVSEEDTMLELRTRVIGREFSVVKRMYQCAVLTIQS